MTNKSIPLTHARLKEVLRYEPETGYFICLIRRRGLKFLPGERLGCLQLSGYWLLEIDGGRYFAAELAWFYVYGEWPEGVVDHRNNRRADDRWDNLRLATWIQNCQNKLIRSDNKSGTTGVFFRKDTGKWSVRIKVNGCYLNIGCFLNKDAAIAARREAEHKYFGEFAPSHGESHA